MDYKQHSKNLLVFVHYSLVVCGMAYVYTVARVKFGHDTTLPVPDLQAVADASATPLEKPIRQNVFVGSHGELFCQEDDGGVSPEECQKTIRDYSKKVKGGEPRHH